jgi:hydroxyacylglutathione hydrolase
MKFFRLVTDLMGVNCYIVYCEATGECAVIDPGANETDIIREIDARGLKVKYILLTHGHFDHIGAVRALKEHTGGLIAIHGEDAVQLTDSRLNLSEYTAIPSVQPEADVMLKNGDTLRVGNVDLIILHTPGHTPGSICILTSDALFTGDTLFQGSVGRTDFPGGSFSRLMHSIKEVLFALPKDYPVYPGHGESTSLSKEQDSNPFI